MIINCKKPRKKSICLFLAGVILANTGLAYSVETNFWTDRRRAQEATVLAQLPSPLGFVPHNNNFPVPPPPRLAAKIESLKLNPNSSRRMLELVKLVPPFLATVRKIESPLSPTGRVVLHLEDIHGHPEAQANLSSVLASLASREKIDVVFLEGAHGPVEISRFHTFPNQHAIQTAAGYLLDQGTMSGPMHRALVTGGSFPPLMGVEDNRLYEANIHAYQRSQIERADVGNRLAALRRQLTQKKSTVFSPELLHWDEIFFAYQEGRMEIGEYLEVLESLSGRHGIVSKGLSMEMFLQTYRLEQALDTTRVEQERAQTLKILMGRLSKPDTDRLVEMSLHFRGGAIRHGDFYAYLGNLCLSRGVDLTGVPHFNAYLRTVLMADALDMDAVTEEKDSLESALFAKLAVTPQEKALVEESRLFALQTKLIDFSLTRQEWETYQSLKKNTWLRTFEDFYEQADARDHSMAANLLNALPAHSDRVSVLVTGGYHSKGIGELLKKAGVTTVTVSPRLTQLDPQVEGSYLSVFSQEKTPLEQLFEGQILFLSPPPQKALPPAAFFAASVDGSLGAIQHFYPESSLRLLNRSDPNSQGPRQMEWENPETGVRLIVEAAKTPDNNIYFQLSSPSVKKPKFDPFVAALKLLSTERGLIHFIVLGLLIILFRNDLSLEILGNASGVMLAAGFAAFPKTPSNVELYALKPHSPSPTTWEEFQFWLNNKVDLFLNRNLSVVFWLKNPVPQLESKWEQALLKPEAQENHKLKLAVNALVENWNESCRLVSRALTDRTVSYGAAFRLSVLSQARAPIPDPTTVEARVQLALGFLGNPPVHDLVFQFIAGKRAQGETRLTAGFRPLTSDEILIANQVRILEREARQASYDLRKPLSVEEEARLTQLRHQLASLEQDVRYSSSNEPAGEPMVLVLVEPSLFREPSLREIKDSVKQRMGAVFETPVLDKIPDITTAYSEPSSSPAIPIKPKRAKPVVSKKQRNPSPDTADMNSALNALKGPGASSLSEFREKIKTLLATAGKDVADYGLNAELYDFYWAFFSSPLPRDNKLRTDNLFKRVWTSSHPQEADVELLSQRLLAFMVMGLEKHGENEGETAGETYPQNEVAQEVHADESKPQLSSINKRGYRYINNVSLLFGPFTNVDRLVKMVKNYLLLDPKEFSRRFPDQAFLMASYLVLTDEIEPARKILFEFKSTDIPNKHPELLTWILNDLGNNTPMLWGPSLSHHLRSKKLLDEISRETLYQWLAGLAPEVKARVQPFVEDVRDSMRGIRSILVPSSSDLSSHFGWAPLGLLFFFGGSAIFADPMLSSYWPLAVGAICLLMGWWIGRYANKMKWMKEKFHSKVRPLIISGVLWNEALRGLLTSAEKEELMSALRTYLKEPTEDADIFQSRMRFIGIFQNWIKENKKMFYESKLLSNRTVLKPESIKDLVYYMDVMIRNEGLDSPEKAADPDFNDVVSLRETLENPKTPDDFLPALTKVINIVRHKDLHTQNPSPRSSRNLKKLILFFKPKKFHENRAVSLVPKFDNERRPVQSIRKPSQKATAARSLNSLVRAGAQPPSVTDVELHELLKEMPLKLGVGATFVQGSTRGKASKRALDSIFRHSLVQAHRDPIKGVLSSLEAQGIAALLLGNRVDLDVDHNDSTSGLSGPLLVPVQGPHGLGWSGVVAFLAQLAGQGENGRVVTVLVPTEDAEPYRTALLGLNAALGNRIKLTEVSRPLVQSGLLSSSEMETWLANNASMQNQTLVLLKGVELDNHFASQPLLNRMKIWLWSDLTQAFVALPTSSLGLLQKIKTHVLALVQA